MKKLRIAHLIIQPVLVWDDGEELTPFEKQVQPVQIPLSKFPEYEKKLKEDIQKLELEIGTSLKKNPFFAEEQEGTGNGI